MLVLLERLKDIGPSLFISFIISGLISLTTALVYCEMAARIPCAGSNYSYVYATYGEFAGWVIGWSMNLRYGIRAGALARGWAHYCDEFFKMIGLTLPAILFDFKVFN